MTRTGRATGVGMPPAPEGLELLTTGDVMERVMAEEKDNAFRV
jgi:hypothetical protein